MGRRVVLLLTACTLGTAAQTLVAPTASADRPVSDITCNRGERATYDRGQHRFEDGALVLGCTALVGGGRLQLEASRGFDDSAPICFQLTGPPPTQGLFVCPRRSGPETRVSLILRHRSPLPILAMGMAPPDTKRLVIAYSTANGTRARARAKLIRAGDRRADRVGAPEAFAAFVAELGPEVDVCRGLQPRAFHRTGSRMLAPPALPRHPLGRPDGWLAGFGPSYGIGYGTGGDAPPVCEGTMRARAADVEPQAALAPGQLPPVLTRLVELVRSVVSAIDP